MELPSIKYLGHLFRRVSIWDTYFVEFDKGYFCSEERSVQPHKSMIHHLQVKPRYSEILGWGATKYVLT